MSAECEYTHDISGDRFSDLPGDEWRCGREAVYGGDVGGAVRCAFHPPAGAAADETARDRLLAAVDGEAGPVRLVGARLGSLDLDYAILGGPSNHPLDLREATVDGDLSVRYATVERPLRLEGSTLRGAVTFEDATLTRRVDLGEVTFEGRVSLRMADFRSWLDLREADFRGPVYARVARFRRGIYGVDARFGAAADFLNSHFDDVANFYRATFERGAVFDSTRFEGNAQFDAATLGAPAVRLDSETGSPRSAGDALVGVALSMDGVTCERNVRLREARLAGDVAFTDSDLGRDLQTAGVSAVDGPVAVDCAGTAVVSGTVDGDGGDVTYDASEAVVGEVNVVGDTSFDAFRFDATTFDGFDFGSYKAELAAREWRLHDEDGDYAPEHLENVYLRAKNGANDIGETRAAGEFFVREMDYRRAGHRRRVVESDSLGGAARAGLRWLSNAALKVSCGYGERPFRPVVFSVIVVLVFAGVYAGLDAPISYRPPFGFVTFSTVGFVSIVLGLPQVAGSVLSFVIAVEAFVGGFIIALFVFTLTRSISR